MNRVKCLELLEKLADDPELERAIKQLCKLSINAEPDPIFYTWNKLWWLCIEAARKAQ